MHSEVPSLFFHRLYQGRVDEAMWNKLVIILLLIAFAIERIDESCNDRKTIMPGYYTVQSVCQYKTLPRNRAPPQT